MNSKLHIYTVDALAGSGKTYQAINYALKRAHYDKQKIVIVLKSKQLMAEAIKTATKFKQQLRSFIELSAISSDHLGINANGEAFTSVQAAILSHLQNSQNHLGEVLLITEVAFLQIPYWHKRWNWHCICDEIPVVSSAYTLNIADHYKLLTQHLKLEPATPSHSHVSVLGDKSVLNAFSNNKNRDDINKYFAPIASEILSKHHNVYTLNSSYYRVLNKSSLNGSYQLHFFSVLKPSIFGSNQQITDAGQFDAFKSVTIMGACFKDSLLYYLWSQFDVEFSEHEEICASLRYARHECGKRLKIKYVFEQNWSKRKRDQTQRVGTGILSNLDVLLTAIEHEFSGNDFVYMVNKDVEIDVKQKLSLIGGQQLPNSPYGLNSYQHLHYATVISALNTTPAHYSFLSEMGIDGDAVREGQYHQACYQAIMRTSLRDSNATEPVTIIVCDKSAALSLQALFAGATVSSIITGINEPEKRRVGRPIAKSKKSRAEIEKQARNTKKQIRQMIAQIHDGIAIDPAEYNAIAIKCRSDNRDFAQLKLLNSSVFSCVSSSSNRCKSDVFSIPVFKSIYSSQPDQQMPINIFDIDGFIGELELASKEPLTEKRKNALISTTEFDSNLSTETSRGLENISRIWGIWLDIDGGAMPKHEIPDLFPDLKMAVFNSYTKGNYRIFIPTTKCMSIGEYADIMQIIVNRVQSHAPDFEILQAKAENRKPRNYVSNKIADKQTKFSKIPNPKHGIDLSKLNPSSLFYMPSLCEDPKESFFNYYNETQRHVLDHNRWLETHEIGSSKIEELIFDEELQLTKQPNVETVDNLVQLSQADQNTAQIIENAMNEYRSIIDGQNRHNGFFKAIYKIHYKAGIPLHELDQYMRDCDYDGHQKSKYKSVLKTLKSGRYQPKQQFVKGN